ncbi:hypothetical protein KO361_05985 [Candidatus Woesearchaeota archaeon]|nr:hypothetical protein [Candidatus Woesearchaeota archaeon]
MSKIPIEVVERYNELVSSIEAEIKNTLPLREKNQAKNLLKKIKESRMPDFSIKDNEGVDISISGILSSYLENIPDKRKKDNRSEITKQIRAIETLYPEIKE